MLCLREILILPLFVCLFLLELFIHITFYEILLTSTCIAFYQSGKTLGDINKQIVEEAALDDYFGEETKKGVGANNKSREKGNPKGHAGEDKFILSKESMEIVDFFGYYAGYAELLYITNIPEPQHTADWRTWFVCCAVLLSLTVVVVIVYVVIVTVIVTPVVHCNTLNYSFLEFIVR